jgi:hypothetical protein
MDRKPEQKWRNTMHKMFIFILLLGMTACDGVMIGEDDTGIDDTNTATTATDSGTTNVVVDSESARDTTVDSSSTPGIILDTVEMDTSTVLIDWDTATETMLDTVSWDTSSEDIDWDTGTDAMVDTVYLDTGSELIEWGDSDSDSGYVYGQVGTRCPTAGYCDVDLECRTDFFYERRVCTIACDMAQDNCPEGSVCVDNIPDYDGGVIGPYCLRPCTYQADCETILGSDCDTIDGLLGRFCF